MHSTQRRFLLSACALLLPLAVACDRQADEADTAVVPADTPAATAAPPAELGRATDAFTAAWNGDDPSAVAAFYAEDATAVVGDSTFRGRAEIEERWLRPNVPVVSNLRPTETSTQQVGSDWRQEGTYTLTASPPGAEPVEDSGRYSVTWTRDAAGEWRIRSSETQSDTPPEG